MNELRFLKFRLKLTSMQLIMLCIYLLWGFLKKNLCTVYVPDVTINGKHFFGAR
jgi:hypothetical protein